MCPPKKVAISDKWEAVLVSFKGSNKHQTKLINLEWIECKPDSVFNDIQSNVIVPGFSRDINFFWRKVNQLVDFLTICTTKRFNHQKITRTLQMQFCKCNFDITFYPLYHEQENGTSFNQLIDLSFLHEFVELYQYPTEYLPHLESIVADDNFTINCQRNVWLEGYQQQAASINWLTWLSYCSGHLIMCQI